MTTIRVSKNGIDSDIDLASVRHVGVRHLGEILGHRILRMDDRTTHEIDFVGGGTVRFSCLADGKVDQLQGCRMEMDLVDGDIIFRGSAPED